MLLALKDKRKLRKLSWLNLPLQPYLVYSKNKIFSFESYHFFFDQDLMFLNTTFYLVFLHILYVKKKIHASSPTDWGRLAMLFTGPYN